MEFHRDCFGSSSVNDLNARIKSILIKSADNTNLGRLTNIVEDRIKIPRDLNKLENWFRDNKIKFSKDKYKVLHKGKKKTNALVQNRGYQFSTILKVKIRLLLPQKAKQRPWV